MSNEPTFMPDSTGGNFEKWLRKKHNIPESLKASYLWHRVEWKDVDEYTAQLEAEKAELLQMVIKLHGSNVYQLSETDMRDGIRFPFALYDEVTVLIQKHAKK